MDELDFCMALDYNYDPSAEKRTLYGEAEYQLKYQHSRPHLSALHAALVDAFADLPIPAEDKHAALISHVPCEPDKCSVARKLATAVAESLGLEYVSAELYCDKSPMKEIPVDLKIPEWEQLYACEGCIDVNGDVPGRAAVIIDDLYMSGATMWCYAKYLKQQEAKYVLGLPCVKSLRDTDNQ